MISTTLVAVTNKICGIIIDVVGEETNKVYSKSVFNIERNTHLEIEKKFSNWNKWLMKNRRQIWQKRIFTYQKSK